VAYSAKLAIAEARPSAFLASANVFGTCFFLVVSTIESSQPINVPTIKMLGVTKSNNLRSKCMIQGKGDQWKSRK